MALPVPRSQSGGSRRKSRDNSSLRGSSSSLNSSMSGRALTARQTEEQETGGAAERRLDDAAKLVAGTPWAAEVGPNIGPKLFGTACYRVILDALATLENSPKKKPVDTR